MDHPIDEIDLCSWWLVERLVHLNSHQRHEGVLLQLETTKFVQLLWQNQQEHLLLLPVQAQEQTVLELELEGLQWLLLLIVPSLCLNIKVG